MYGIQPRSLTTQELIRFSAELMELPAGMPKDVPAQWSPSTNSYWIDGKQYKVK